MLFCITCWYIYQKLFITITIEKAKFYRILFSFLLILSIGTMALFYDHVFSYLSGQILQFTELDVSKRNYILLFRGMVISALFYFVSYYLHILDQKQKNLVEIEQLKQAQLAATLFSLKEQLSPHFLFNTLNTLSSLSHENEVKNYISELANVYRYVLKYKDINTTSLQQELEFITSYLYIIKIRLEEAIDVRIEVNPKIMLSQIPSLTLQLLVENAIKHNVAAASKKLKISITDMGGKFLIVTNNLQPKLSVPDSTGLGLDNVMNRYRLLFNKDVIIEKSDQFFTVKLPII